MYVRTDTGDPNPRLGFMAEQMQEQLVEHSLPNNIIGTRFEVVEAGGDIEEPIGIDYSRWTVALRGAVKELARRVEELESK